MKESFWGYLILLFGIFVVIIMMIIRDYQTTNDEDYYIMKEVTQAAMIDAVDYAYYREHNDLRIIEDKFAENFLRRFAQSMSSNKTYKIELFEINENPPKVSVRITTATGEYIVHQDEGGVDFGVVNILSAILDMKHENVVYNNDGMPNADPSDPDVEINTPDDEDDDEPETSSITPVCKVKNPKYTTFSNSELGIDYYTYDQTYSEWGSLEYYSGKTMAEIGCMNTAEAVILSAYDSSITPKTLYTENPNAWPTTAISNMSDGNISCAWGTYSNVVSHLQTGQSVLVHVQDDGDASNGDNPFTSGSHYFALLGYDSSTNKVYVGNSAYKGTYGQAGWYNISSVFIDVETIWLCTYSNKIIEPC